MIATDETNAAAAASTRLHTVFKRQGQLFALPVEGVREVVPAQSLTRIAGTSTEMAGAFSLRGEILPVALIDTRLGLGFQPYKTGCPLLVLRHGDSMVGVQVDAVLRVASISAGEIVEHPNTRRMPHIAGIWSPDSTPVTVLNGAELMSQMKSTFSSRGTTA